VCEFVLAKNGRELRASEAEKCAMFLELAEGKISEAEFAAWMAASC
jgi:prophage maintenance system killer protein